MNKYEQYLKTKEKEYPKKEWVSGETVLIQGDYHPPDPEYVRGRIDWLTQAHNRWVYQVMFRLP